MAKGIANEVIEMNARLHPQDASVLLSQSQQGNLALHVDGCFQRKKLKPIRSIFPGVPSVSDFLNIKSQKLENPQKKRLQSIEPLSLASTTSCTENSLPMSAHARTSNILSFVNHGIKRSHGFYGTSTIATTITESPGCCDNANSHIAKRFCNMDTKNSTVSNTNFSRVHINVLLNSNVSENSVATAPTSMHRSFSNDMTEGLKLMQKFHPHIQSDSSVTKPPCICRPSTTPGISYHQNSFLDEALKLDKLYDIACAIIESVWPNHSASQHTQLCTLRCFVAETHRQSRLGSDVLELCMFYLLRFKLIMQAKQRAKIQKEQLKLQQLKHQALEMELGYNKFNSSGKYIVDMTPPLSPSSPHSPTNTKQNGLSLNINRVNNGNLLGVNMASPRSISPITPTSAQGNFQASSVNNISINNGGLISPISPEKLMLIQGVLSGNPGPLFKSSSFGACSASKAPLTNNSGIISMPDNKRLISTTCLNDTSMQCQISTAQRQLLYIQLQQRQQKKDDKSKRGDVTKCGRRMFVAALISASKFLYDRAYSNVAWHKITRLPVAQINEMERRFLDVIDYRLFVEEKTYNKFHRLLAKSAMRNGLLVVCGSSSNSAPEPSITSLYNKFVPSTAAYP